MKRERFIYGTLTGFRLKQDQIAGGGGLTGVFCLFQSNLEARNIPGPGPSFCVYSAKGVKFARPDCGLYSLTLYRLRSCCGRRRLRRSKLLMFTQIYFTAVWVPSSQGSIDPLILFRLPQLPPPSLSPSLPFNTPSSFPLDCILSA